MSNLVVHFEIHGTEPQQLIDFYSKLLGWTFTQYGEMEYWSIDTGDGSIRPSEGAAGHGINGGLLRREGSAPMPGASVKGCNLVIAVDGIDGLMATGVELGGSVALAAEDMPGLGRLGYLLDPDGNVFGMLQSTLSDGTPAM
ncbi:VOC family protein [Agromyces mangrovi Wang et al. 2018]|uniref:VOC family protein n=1 Tax=Agromyces mangrovi TaxID=1858653 RepID=UPI002574360B|nr:VOC family protein [Agromyces mangrovi]BDZ65530.1 glyoxalase [Agromyces mangrovi]